MKLLFKQRMFSWFGSYDIFNEYGETVYTVKGQLAWGHCFKIFDASGRELGTVKQRIFSFLPRYEIYRGESYVGCITKEFTFFKPRFDIDFNGWSVEGSFWEWDYSVCSATGGEIAVVSKEIWNWTDTYSIVVGNPDDALNVLMLVLAIDAEKDRRSN